MNQSNLRPSDFETKTEAIGDLTLHFLRKIGMPDFLPAKITRNDQVLWAWSDAKSNYPPRSIGFFVEVDELHVIAAVDRAHLHEVFVVEDMTNVKSGGLFGKIRYTNRDLKSMMRLKEQVATKLNLDPAWTLAEQKVIARELAVKRAENEAARAAQQVAAEAKREAEIKRKLDRIAAIKGRSEIYAFTSDNVRRKGFPVVGDEWHVLPRDTPCILVESYDTEIKAAGAAIEAFFVDKSDGGRISKKNPKSVTYARPKSAEVVVELASVGTEVVDMGEGDYREVVVFKTMDDIKRARDAGLNGGTLVTIGGKQPDGKLRIFSVTGKQIQDRGLYVAL